MPQATPRQRALSSGSTPSCSSSQTWSARGHSTSGFSDIDPVDQGPRVASFDVRNARLLLHADAEDSPGTPRGVGAHLHLRVHGIHGLWHRLRSEGLAPPAAPAERPWGVVAFSLTDPDGYLLEFVEPA